MSENMANEIWTKMSIDAILGVVYGLDKRENVQFAGTLNKRCTGRCFQVCRSTLERKKS